MATNPNGRRSYLDRLVSTTVGRISVGLFIPLCLASATPASAQTWACVVPPNCRIDATAGQTVHPFVLKLNTAATLPTSNHLFNVSTSNIPITRVTVTNPGNRTSSAGLVVGYITGPISSNGQIIFRTQTSTGTTSEQVLTVGPPPSSLSFLGDSEFHWVVNSQIPNDAVGVKIAGVRGNACERMVVAYRASSDGSTSPDSVFGTPRGAECVFPVSWRLGERVGAQHLQGRLRGSPAPPMTLSAIARRKPGLRASLAAAFLWPGASTLETTQVRKLTVTRTRPDGTTIQFDSTVVAAKVVDTGWDIEAMPLVVFDTPILPKWERIRVAIGASLVNITEDFFFGLSALQAMEGIRWEDVGVDIQVGLIFSRDERLVHSELCKESLSDEVQASEPCKITDGLRAAGFAATGSIDAASLLSAFGKLLGFS